MFFCTPLLLPKNRSELISISILSSALALANVILAGKRDSRRYSTTRFSKNVIVAGPSYQILEV